MELISNCPICNSEKFTTKYSTKDYFFTQETFNIVTCDNCNFAFTNPRPEESKISDYYKTKDYVSHSNSKKSLFENLYHIVRNINLKKKFKLINQFKQSGNILDIGCGTGYFLNYMKNKKWQTTGIEPDQDARNFAKDNFQLEVYSEKYLDEIPDKSFDIITLWHVLEHVYPLNNRVLQLKRLLKNDGYLIIAVPNIESQDAVIYGKYWASLDVPRHIYHFSEKDIENLFKKIDFEIINKKPMPFDSFYVSLLSEKYIHGKMRWIPAVRKALISNLKYGKQNGYSSMIYILKNQK